VVYAPPSLATLRGYVAMDLRDSGLKTFTAPEVNALINGAIVEVSRVYPKEAIDAIVFDTGASAYPTDFEQVFRCEVFRNGVYYATIPPNESDDSAQGGFDLFGGEIHLPWSAVARLVETSNDSLRLWGYKPRDILETDAESLDGDADTEHAVRLHAVLTGYQRLANSQALFQQWTQESRNTEVSPTQLIGMASTFESQWQRVRQQLRTLRRR
jgi:hypothetical protein